MQYTVHWKLHLFNDLIYDLKIFIGAKLKACEEIYNFKSCFWGYTNNFEDVTYMV